MTTSDRTCVGAAAEQRGACRRCGLAVAEIAPAEAAAALRALPLRWHSALAVNLEDADPDTVLASSPGPGQWSALEHAGHVRDVLHALDIRVQRVLREENPVLPGTHVTPPAGANEQGTAVVLAALGVSVDQLTRTILVNSETDWARRGRRARQSVSALDLVREAVHEAVHHLCLAEAAVAALRLAPLSIR